MPSVKIENESVNVAYSFADDMPNSAMTDVPGARVEGASSGRMRRRSGLYRRLGKRLLDIVTVIVLSPVAIPVLMVVAFITALDGGRVFFSQPRIGRDGRVFKCWKIRTMVPNAEAVLKRMISADEDVAREWQTNQKLAHDPRVTRWGRLLRRSSIDELPQFWNVLAGDMSLIGPRPFTPEQKALYDQCGQSDAYYRLRPGITGLWQVDRRNEGAFGDRVSYDREYDERLSFWTDTKIILRTLMVVLKGTGN